MDTPLKKERERRRLTQHQVADAVGIDRSHYSRLEKGQVGASTEIAEKLSAYFGHAISEMQILYPERFAATKDGEAA